MCCVDDAPPSDSSQRTPPHAGTLFFGLRTSSHTVSRLFDLPVGCVDVPLRAASFSFLCLSCHLLWYSVVLFAFGLQVCCVDDVPPRGSYHTPPLADSSYQLSLLAVSSQQSPPLVGSLFSYLLVGFLWCVDAPLNSDFSSLLLLVHHFCWYSVLCFLSGLRMSFVDVSPRAGSVFSLQISRSILLLPRFGVVRCSLRSYTGPSPLFSLLLVPILPLHRSLVLDRCLSSSHLLRISQLLGSCFAGAGSLHDLGVT